MKRLIFVLSLVLLGLFAAQGEAQTLCIGPNCAPTTITNGVTPTSGCLDGGVLRSVSNLIDCSSALSSTITKSSTATSGFATPSLIGSNTNLAVEYTLSGTGTVIPTTVSPVFTTPNIGVATGTNLTIGSAFTAGNAILVFRSAITGATINDNYFNVQSAFPTTHAADAYGFRFLVSGSGSYTNKQTAGQVSLLAGYTGSGASTGLIVTNLSASTNTSIGNVGLSALINSNSTVFNTGLHARSSNTGAGLGAGGVFVIGSSAAITPSSVSTAILLDNQSTAAALLIARDNLAALPTTGATATWQLMDGAIPQVGTGVLTTATMAAEAQAYARGSMVHSATWTNAQVVALGASLTGDIKAFTIPAKHVVENAYIIITGAAAGTTTLTVSCGRTSASYIDYIVASDAQAAANTVYGGASAERGTNLTGYDLPSYTGTTDVYCHFTSTVSNLSSVTGSTGRVVLVTTLIP